ncbi:hypothetical protein ASPCAL09314 [Aspergillus calidoustus]|uniref:Uncharacterized protein n=1 Tax=Aspergillus calidoustus TaxID=454130 RepID=A0A0U5GUE2_ASPCI|nr:hypothetical protein ASPCAL09314 [Aspergillus calidoustus]
MPSNDAPNEACPNEIPWPTIFFWMICFAINAAAQSTGRVLNLDLSFGQLALLRSSPIISIFDATGVVASLLTTTYQSPIITTTRIREAASRMLLRRIVDEEDDDRPDIRAIQSLKAQRWPRWIGFLLGALPQFLKLFAARGLGVGIALSQALGAMYLASWIIFEALILIADIDGIESIRARGKPGPRPRHQPDYIRVLAEIWTAIAILTSAIIYALPAWSIYLTSRALIAENPASPSMAFVLNYMLFPAGLIGFHIPVWADLLWTTDPETDSAKGWFVLLGTFVHFAVPLAAVHSKAEAFGFSDGMGRAWVEGALGAACVLGLDFSENGSIARYFAHLIISGFDIAARSFGIALHESAS